MTNELSLSDRIFDALTSSEATKEYHFITRPGNDVFDRYTLTFCSGLEPQAEKIAGIVKKILPDATIIPFTEFHRYERKRTLVTYAAPALTVSLDSSSESVTISFATAKSEEYRIVSERAIEGRLIFPGIVRDIIKLG
ncbi:TPA: hypothetical protein HA372_06135 [Candidatus Woesearchaeota archaeon]|nr:hypothetical protein [Candidatus Woesearchaeota archaeon]HII65784.1 hypothetical protein [Candidatus Woesearchaeota archaeon]HIJ19237.1 hypothetical protein [Candidatus Woesearchaeota archaeon]